MSLMQPDGTINLRVIRPGWGSSGFYSSDVLKRDGPNIFKKGLHMHLDHPTLTEARERPERSVATIGGVLESDARWLEKGPEGPGLYAKARPVGAFKQVFEDLAPHIGVSIRALGKARDGEAEGRKGKIIESLTGAQSLDWVTAAGAGGKVVQLFESTRAALITEATRSTDPARGAEKPKGGKPVSKDFDATVLEEAQKASDARIKELEETVRRSNEREQLREAEDLIRRELASAELPDITRTRISSEVMHRLPLTGAGDVDRDKLQEQIREAVRGEVAYITTLTGGGRIRGMGSTQTEMGYPEEQVKAGQDRLQESFRRVGMSEEAAKHAAAGRR